jgi:hypothetical protein
MDNQTGENVEYRGYVIVSKPARNPRDDLWHDGYQISKSGVSVANFTNTEVVHNNWKAAYDSSILLAKNEVDNLIAI